MTVINSERISGGELRRAGRDRLTEAFPKGNVSGGSYRVSVLHQDAPPLLGRHRVTVAQHDSLFSTWHDLSDVFLDSDKRRDTKWT